MPPVGAAPAAGRDRLDLRDLETLTIDPEGAKDHDDALSIDGDRVYVHIADVAAHVPAGSGLDAEAARRGTSVYLPGRVDPMLPAELSADRCSLRAGADRLAVSLALGPGREVTAHRTLIRSDHSLTYPQAQAILDGAPAPGPLAAAVRRTAELADDLRSRRMARGALAIETREIEISIGAGTLDARVRAHTPAHGLIEELMILANRRVAELIVEAGRPALHRVHEPPDASSIAVLLERLEALGVPTPPAPTLHGGPETARYAGLLSRAVMRYAAREGRGVEAWPGMVLRSVQKARYDPSPLGHSGIAARHYCHFTSPIRRYPGPGLPPRAPGRARARRGGARRRARRPRRPLLAGRAGRRAAGAPRNRHLPGVPARAPALRRGVGDGVRRRGRRPHRGRRVRAVR